MSSPRLSLLILPLALGLPLLTGACGAPVAIVAASYGADGVSLAETGKTSTDHMASMVSKKDCALWRVFRNQSICRAQEGNANPYKVNYDEPFRQQTEGGGVEYAPPPHAEPNAPAASWDAAAYKPATPEPPTPPMSTTAVADVTPPAAGPASAVAAPVAKPVPAPTHVAHKAKAKKVKAVAVKKPSPDQVASSR